MAEATRIVIKQEYFDNIKVAIDSLNNFFGSNFKTKNFPMIDSNEQLDASMLSILSWMNNVDPTWIEDTEKLNDVIDKINDAAENNEESEDLLTVLTNNNDTSMLDAINAVIGHKMLQYIADHFDIFSELMNGIYTFELFTKPSMFRKAIDTFSKPVPMDEIENALGDNQYQVFNEEKYLHGVFDNPQITLPKTMKLETEKTRFENREDLQNIDIVIDDTVQEAAEINYFVEMKPEHLKYHSGLRVVQISKQFEAKVNKLVSDLRACNTTDDLKKYFENFPFSPDDFSHVVIPCILARVFASSRKFPNQSFDQLGLKKYTDSYKSILSQNAGANRFANYDLFSTFKADKEGTIKFIEDFLKLRLVNDESGAISNNTLLTLFNIFDSRIYLDIMYNMLPNDVRTSKAPSEDAFVKKVRAKINKNSRNANIYQKATVPSDNTVQTSDQVVEYVTEAFNQAGIITTTDLRYCEQYADLIHDEINTIGDKLYNAGVSVDELDEYIGESYDLFMEANEASKKARKRAQQFMKDEYGKAHPTSMPSKQRNRMKKWLTDNDYDPKTKTIKTDIVDKKTGKPVRVNVGTNFTEPMLGTNKPMPFAQTQKMNKQRREQISNLVGSYDPTYIDNERWENLTKGDRSYINMPKSYMKRHPAISNGISKHEEGHIADLQYGEKIPGYKEGKELMKRVKRNKINVGTHADPREFAADIYSVQHNPHKDKMRVFRALKTSDNEMSKQYRYLSRQAKRGIHDAFGIEDKESLMNAVEIIISSTEDNIKLMKSMPQTSEVKNAIDVAKDGVVEYKKLLDQIKDMDFDNANKKFMDTQTKTIRDNIKSACAIIDREADLRSMIAKKFINEFAVENDMTMLDVISEMYQTEFEDYVLCEYDFPEDDMSDDEVDAYIQEGLISKFFENRKKKKERASTEAQLKAFEDKYNVKLTEEHRSIILDNPNQYEAISNNIQVRLNCDYSNKMYELYDYSFKHIHSIFKDNSNGMYPIMFADFEYDNMQYQDLYSDSEGNIYAAIYNKRHKFEKVASSIKDFFDTYKDKNVYWKFTEVCHDLMYVYYNDETHKDEEHHVQIVLHTDSNGAVNPKAASDISMYATSGVFSEKIVDEVLPKTKEKFGSICHVKRAVFDMDGNMDLFIKYNGKEMSLKSSGIWTEAFVQENSPDIDGSIPDYMKTRIKLSDGGEDEKPQKEPVVTDVQLPPDIPSNAFDDLANSIDARLDTPNGNLNDMLGNGYDGAISKTGGDGKVVYNITYNYNNSYNQTNSNNKTEKNSHNITDTHNSSDSHNTVNDLSSNKKTNTNSHNQNSTRRSVNNNSHNVNPPRYRGSNNNNNSTVLSDTKDSNADNTFKKDTFSTGKSIQEVFAFLESEEPLSDTMSVNTPPKEDMLTKAMDNDRKSLPKLQSAKKNVQKIGNTARAAVKPIGRTKQWLNNMINSVIKRDEDKVKKEMIENPSYRAAVFKASRIALKLGLFAGFTALNPYLGVIYAGAEGLKLADRNRLRKEVQDEFATELRIMDEKIEQCKHELNYSYGAADPKKKQELYQLMRQRDKMQQMAPQSMKTYVKRATDIY